MLNFCLGAATAKFNFYSNQITVLAPLRLARGREAQKRRVVFAFCAIKLSMGTHESTFFSNFLLLEFNNIKVPSPMIGNNWKGLVLCAFSLVWVSRWILSSIYDAYWALLKLMSLKDFLWKYKFSPETTQFLSILAHLKHSRKSQQILILSNIARLSAFSKNKKCETFWAMP